MQIYSCDSDRMPLTPVTSVLLDQEYVKQEWPVLGSRLMIEKKEVPDKYRKCSANKGNILSVPLME